MQYYTWIYFMCIYLILRQWWYMYFTFCVQWDFLGQSSDDFNGLQSQYWPTADEMREAHDKEPSAYPSTLDEWSDDVLMPMWLRWLAVVAQFPTNLVCVLICMYHTYQHVQQEEVNGRFPIRLTQTRDHAVQVIALPAIYATMAGKGGLRAISLMLGEFMTSGWDTELTTWFKKAQMESNIYESEYKVAEIYEAWALTRFAKLCAFVVASMEARMASRKMEQALAAAAGPGAGEKVMAVWREQQPRILKEKQLMGDLMVFGISVFAGVNAAVGLYNVALGLLPQAPFKYDVCGFHPEWCDLGLFWQGCNFVASLVGLTNIVMFETKMHEALHNIRPGPKFWGVKLLVMISFWQQILVHVLPVVRDFSLQQRNLLISCVTVIEVTIIAGVHVWAWEPKADWYKQESELTEPLLDSAE